MDSNRKDLPVNIFILFLLLWGIINLLQAWFTPLNPDESYYWMYSRQPDWGYFDHPPMIALMIRAGYWIFHNELGVRLLTVFSQTAVFLILWKLSKDGEDSDRTKTIIFILILALMPVFTIYGFISTPDVPLILFSSLFLLVYRRFLVAENLTNTLLLGVSMAAMVYSKYHGVLLIIFVLLSNLKLFRSWKFYVASLLAVFLFLPHIIWQFTNGFVSFKFHLVERVSAYNISEVPEYIANTILIHNPLFLPLTLWIILRKKATDQFERALYFIVTGFLGFFFIASFRDHIEPQWTALASIPLVLILYKNMTFRSWIPSVTKRMAFFFLPIVLFFRLAFMIDFLPVSFLKKDYHERKEWAMEISNLAGDRPVVFTNSYQRPSEYTFYTGKFSHSLNNLVYRKTQYDLWDFEEKLHGREVLYVPHYLSTDYKKNLTKHLLPDGDSIFTSVIRNFQSLQRECVILRQDNYSFSNSRDNNIHLEIFNPYPYILDIDHSELPVVFQIGFFSNGLMQFKQNLILPDNITALNPGDTISVDCRFNTGDLPPGRYKLAICSETGYLYDTINSRIRDAVISE